MSGFGEETGWRGFALDRLLGWHVPSFYLSRPTALGRALTANQVVSAAIFLGTDRAKGRRIVNIAAGPPLARSVIAPMPRRRPLLLVTLLGGCITPSLPVPPPEPAFLAFTVDGANGRASFHADSLPDWAGAKVSVFDESTGQGVIVRANGDGSVSPTPSFAARDGDRVTVEYALPDQSAGRCLILHDGHSRSDFLCP